MHQLFSSIPINSICFYWLLITELNTRCNKQHFLLQGHKKFPHILYDLFDMQSKNHHIQWDPMYSLMKHFAFVCLQMLLHVCFKPVSFPDFQSPNRGGSHWIARALLEICDVLVEQWLNLRSLNSSLGTSRDKRETTKETVSEWQQWQPPCILRGNGLATENQEKRRACFSSLSTKIWHSRVICVFLRWGLT